ncbi:MAG: ABC-F family ATP-binding cassette domain-containing protein [Cytophagaceae bacterium]|nr:ABC-F family ATP-binding cassette domain-containing protein [Cytophagaceae bacterium]MDW8455162.1 ABC-F family ATP-binding cassette domain-containing protein [Cytophagaceae bacterium]
MLTINGLSFFFGSRVLYDEVSLHIKPKDKIGLIGANGTGKSTLLRLINGEYTPDEGEISKSNDCTIGFLNQDLLSYESDEPILHIAMMAYHEAMQVQKQIDEVLHQMEENYSDDLMEKLSKLQERFEILEGYTLQSNAEKILEGLGFSTADLNKPLRTFSGGWRMRVMLAQMLLSKPSLLMLDEPTNHLDMPSIQWLENYLANYEGAVIIVSHDRCFLDNCVKTIVEVSQSKLNVYSGNYSYYLKEKELRKEIQQNAYDNQQAKIRQAERFIARFKAKASKARQVQSKIKSLEKLELIPEVVDESAKVHFKFNFKINPGRNIIELKEVSKRYGDITILDKTSIRIDRGDKIALIGANGKGKSTLLRILAGTEPILGERITGHNVIISFFAQHQLEALNLENTLLDELKEMGTDKTETELRSILGCFLFSDDDVFKKIKVLSGGEKSRVALAKVLLSEANFLLLDEPTNHLDIQSVNILTQALQQYQGSFVCISHDRQFVSEIANKIWYIDNYQIKEYPGTYREYVDWISSRQPEQSAVHNEAKPKKTESTTTQTKRNFNATTHELNKMKQQITDKENQITETEKNIAAEEMKLTDPTLYTKPEELKTINTYLIQLKKKLEQLQNEWEELYMEYEAASLSSHKNSTV